VVTWDLPGHGASEAARSEHSTTIEAQADIIARIMDKEHIARAVQAGFSMGAQIVLETAHLKPMRCEALVLAFGPAEATISSTRLMGLSGHLLAEALLRVPAPVFRHGLRAAARVADTRAGHALARAAGLVGKDCSDDDLHEITAHLRRLDPRSVRALSRGSERHSAMRVLARLRIPVLILAGDRDPFSPLTSVGQSLHRSALSSELHELRGGTHTALLERPGEVTDAIESFIARRLSSAIHAS
jgi:pimeloyl-ACP methyl ester carboxylesterase